MKTSRLVVTALTIMTIGTGHTKSAPAGLPDEPIWSLAATGDSIITRRIAVYDDEPFTRLIDIIRNADVAFTNLECQLFRFSEFKGYPQAENGGGYELGPPEAAADLKWAGFDIVNRANNHTTDYGVEGMFETSKALDAVGLIHAGVGRNAGEASRASYLDTNKGRVALIGLATTFSPMERAGEARQDIQGRPGLNGLRVDRTFQLAPQDMTALRRIVRGLGGTTPDSDSDPIRFRGLTFAPGATTTVIEKVNPRDEERILRNIRSASRQADYVIVTSHSHEAGPTPDDPPPFLVEFIKKCIDAGATTYIVHGPHRLRGIEIYKGRPIFYSLADFIFQYETTEPRAPTSTTALTCLTQTRWSASCTSARTSGAPTDPHLRTRPGGERRRRTGIPRSHHHRAKALSDRVRTYGHPIDR